MNKTSDDGCIFIVRPQVLPASHMDTHGTGVLAHAGQPEKGQDGVCMAVNERKRERECVDVCVYATLLKQVSVLWCVCVCVCDSSA